jgi:hypothetical protein
MMQFLSTFGQTACLLYDSNTTTVVLSMLGLKPYLNPFHNLIIAWEFQNNSKFPGCLGYSDRSALKFKHTLQSMTAPEWTLFHSILSLLLWLISWAMALLERGSQVYSATFPAKMKTKTTKRCSSLVHSIYTAAMWNVSQYHHYSKDDNANRRGFIFSTSADLFSAAIITSEVN